MGPPETALSRRPASSTRLRAKPSTAQTPMADCTLLTDFQPRKNTRTTKKGHAGFALFAFFCG